MSYTDEALAELIGRPDVADLVDSLCATLQKMGEPGVGEPGATDVEAQRRLVERTLEALALMQYRIVPTGNSHGASEIDAPIALTAVKIEEVTRLVVNDDQASLYGLWRIYDDDEAVWPAEVYAALGAYFRRRDPLLAYEVFSAGLARFGGDQRLRYDLALTLARLGANSRALALARGLQEENISRSDLSTDVLSLVARLHKDRALGFDDMARRRGPMEESLSAYLSAYGKAADGCKSYPAINAATLALLLGDHGLATRLAGEAHGHAEEELRNGTANPHWQIATKAEALLVLGKFDEAARCYEKAVEAAGSRYDDIASMRKNACLIAKHVDRPVDWVESVLRLPTVVIFSGHMIDRPGRRRSRFPALIESQVTLAIRNQLSELNAGFGFSGAACGSDILFLEEMGKRGDTHILLPFARKEFVAESVEIVEGNWRARFEDALAAATGVEVASDSPREWGGIVFEYASLLLLGLAELRARALGTELVGLAVYDEGPSDGPGGTAATVEAWRVRGLRVVQIDPCSFFNENARVR